jgi:hypothetical protein
VVPTQRWWVPSEHASRRMLVSSSIRVMSRLQPEGFAGYQAPSPILPLLTANRTLPLTHFPDAPGTALKA